ASVASSTTPSRSTRPEPQPVIGGPVFDAVTQGRQGVSNGSECRVQRVRLPFSNVHRCACLGPAGALEALSFASSNAFTLAASSALTIRFDALPPWRALVANPIATVGFVSGLPLVRHP